MRSRFDEQLDQLNQELIVMGSMCEQVIAMAAKALMEEDINLAKKVPDLSSQIDRKERDIEGMCIKLLLQQQPVAKDLRTVSSALKMVTDLERIGHQSADIAEIITMENISASKDLQLIHDMALATINMVTDSIDAFVKKDINIAKSVVDADDVVDHCFDEIKKLLIEQFHDSRNDTEFALDLLMISKYFERIGDHAVNVAQWVIYSITGNREEGIV